MSIKLVTDQTHRFGTKRVLPVIGVTEISTDGTIEVPNEEIANEIVESGIGFYFEDISKQQTEKNTIQEQKESTTPLETTSTTTTTTSTTTIKPEDDKITSEELQLLKVDELRELAKDLPNEEWKDLKKAELIEYLQSKL